MEQNPNRVKFFEKPIMCESVASQKWDLIKVICTQPYTTRKQYGIAFITLYSREDESGGENVRKVQNLSEVQKRDLPKPEVQKENPKAEVQKETPKPEVTSKSKRIGGFTFRDSSDEDENNETSPFQRWKMKKEAPKPDIKAQMKKLNENRKRIHSTSSSDDDKKSSRSKPKVENRNRSKGLFYESEDDEPNERLQKKIDKDNERKISKPQIKSPANKFSSFITNNDNPSTSSTSQQTKPKTTTTVCKKELKYKPFDKLFEDVIFVLSGYQNPERGILRQKALDMGARYKADWNNTCTHLM